MQNRNLLFVIIAVCVVILAIVILQKPSTTNNVEDALEDAAHNTGQAIDRAGDKIQDVVD